MTRKEMDKFLEEIEQLWCDKSDLEDLVVHLELELDEAKEKIEHLNDYIESLTGIR